MRYPPEHKTRTRDALVASSAAVAKRDGFAAAGVDAFARAAGLTSGAFYRHFDGKAALLAAIVEHELATTRERFAAVSTSEQMLLAIDAYLSLGHVRHPELGCVLPTLGAEVARAELETKQIYERAFEELQAFLGEKVGDVEVAAAVVSLCAGAVMIARGLATDDARRSVLRAARAGARRLLSEPAG